MRKTIGIIVFLFNWNLLFGQSTYLPLGSLGFHILDRMEIKSGRLADPMEFITTTKSYRREIISHYTDSFALNGIALSKQDLFNLDYLQNDNFEWSNSELTKSKKPIRQIFRHKAGGYDEKNNVFNLVINPIMLLSAGYDTRLKGTTSINNRGIEIRGSLKGVIGFYTRFSDEIQTVNSWVLDNYQKDSIIPGAGFLKTTNGKQFNYWLASGYLTFNVSPYIDVQFGHGRNFIGNGYRSFYISDFSRDHMFLRVNTHFWKINYTNIWGIIYNHTPGLESVLPKRHYYATTHLSINAGKNFNFGVFQTISYQRDSGYSNGGMELEYFNPIILYKPIENGLNSPDKAILGVDVKANFLHHFSGYGQFVISEFVMKEVLAGNGWWGNKQAMQAGLKYIDAFGISNLDLQAEYNICRPYMYTSFDPKNAWVNDRQNMAHPLGANFKELVTIIRYQPVNRLMVKFTGIFSVYGNDTGSSNWGKAIDLTYLTRPREYGNTIGQGIRTNLFMTDVTLSWMIKHNLFLDLQFLYRRTTSDDPQFKTQTTLLNTAVRWNISQRRYDF